VDALNTQIADKSAALKAAEKTAGENNIVTVQTEAELSLLRSTCAMRKPHSPRKRRRLRHLQVVRSTERAARRWRSTGRTSAAGLTLMKRATACASFSANGFQLVAAARWWCHPQGLPTSKMPSFQPHALVRCCRPPLVISLVVHGGTPSPRPLRPEPGNVSIPTRSWSARAWPT